WFGHVPHVGPQAWLHYFFPPLTREGIVQLERETMRPLAPDMAEWLALSNGLFMFSAGLVLFGLRTDYSRDPDFVQPYPLDTIERRERPRDSDDSFCFVGASDDARLETYWTGSNLYIDTRDG